MKKSTYQEAGEERKQRRHRELPPSTEPVSTPYSLSKSSLSRAIEVPEVVALKELESMVRALMDVVPLPEVWDNRLHKQLHSIARARVNR